MAAKLLPLLFFLSQKTKISALLLKKTDVAYSESQMGSPKPNPRIG